MHFTLDTTSLPVSLEAFSMVRPTVAVSKSSLVSQLSHLVLQYFLSVGNRFHQAAPKLCHSFLLFFLPAFSRLFVMSMVPLVFFIPSYERGEGEVSFFFLLFSLPLSLRKRLPLGHLSRPRDLP